MTQINARPQATKWMIVVMGGALFLGGLLQGRYLGRGWPFDSPIAGSDSDPHAGHAQDGHDGHDHEGHDHGQTAGNFVELTETARKNLGLTEEYLQPIELSSFDRTISVPAIIVDRPGRTRLPVSAATTGIVTHVHAVTGEALSSGDLILEMRLTHEDLVTAQREYLQALGDRDVESKEIARIENIASAGAVSNKTLLERQYNRDKIDSLLKSQREALRLHGLSDEQIKAIDTERRLLTELKVCAPNPDQHSAEELQLSRQNRRLDTLYISTSHAIDTEKLHSHADHETSKANRLLVLQDLDVQKGQVVSAGDLLCTLADFSELLIEGQAFESEASLVTKAKLQDWKVSASIEESGRTERVDDLELGWVDNEIDSVTRTLKFYALLPNALMQESINSGGQRHIVWRYRTGQRLQLQIPIERWTEQIVLPVDAVVRDGLESYVFQQNGDHYDRIAIHERFRDQTSVVVENDGTIFPGDVVARRGAHQLQMALKNQASGGVDPHAGHSH